MVDRALSVLEIDSGISAALKACNSTIKINFPVEINGKIEVFTGWRSVHSDHRVVVDSLLSLMKMKSRPWRH